MKYGFPFLFILLILFSFTGSTSFSTHNEDDDTLSEFQIRNLATFCKVWGFLKYYHPYPSKKDVDWDKVLIENYPKVISASTKEEFNRVISSIFNLTGPLKSKKSSFHPVDSLGRNIDFHWLSDTASLSSENSNYLQAVLKDHRPFKSKYIQSVPSVNNPMIEEQYYPEMVFPDEAFRFLALARYWNIIEYYFPSKYLMTENWNASLAEGIPLFQSATNKEEYCRSIQWITARIDDTHAFYVYAPWRTPTKIPAISVTYINDSLVVTHIPNDSIAAISGIKAGDLITSINGKSVQDVWLDYRTHHSLSNIAVGEFRFAKEYGALITNQDTTLLTVNRGGVLIDIKLKNYSYSQIRGLWKLPKLKVRPRTEILTDSVSNRRYAYFNLGTLEKGQVDSMLALMTGVNEIILDARNYPKEFRAWIHLANKIVSPRQHIAQMSYPDYRHPGFLNFSMVDLKMGTTDDKVFKGKVYILVDHRTLSQAEYQVMALRKAPEAKVIGTQTAGADGDVSVIVLPGGYQTYFSGLGWYYADGRQTQRIGIVPDIKVEYTVETELAQRDPIMEKALELIRAGK